MALHEKLGGDNEASRMMGRATQSVASHFATQTQIDAVSCNPAGHWEFTCRAFGQSPARHWEFTCRALGICLQGTRHLPAGH